MSRLNIYLLLVLAFLLIFAQQDSAVVDNSISRATPIPTLSPTPTPTPTPTIPPPATLIIPKIQITAPIQPVGTDIDGKMELPQDINVVGWYSPGFKPGELGNAVISGHLDAATGANAIFYNLRLVEPGDEIITVSEDGKEYVFKVVEKIIYPFNQVPIDSIFGKSSQKKLNLITCTGVWDPYQKNYSERMIILAEIQE